VNNEPDEAFPPQPSGETDQTQEFPAGAGEQQAPGWEAWPPPPPPPPGMPHAGYGTAGAAYQPGVGQAPPWWAQDPAYTPSAREAAWPRRGPRRRWPIAAGVAAALVVGTAGGFIGDAIAGSRAAPASSASSANPPANGGVGSGTGGSGNGSNVPFGNGNGAGSGSQNGFPGNGFGPGSGFGGGGSNGTAPSTGGTGPSDASSIAKRVDPGLVDVNTTIDYGSAEGAGTGMVLTSNGEVLTNNHVVEGATSISVTDVGNGRTYGATVVGYSVARDVAVLKLTNASGLQTVTTDSAKASVGAEVVGIGNAGGTGGTPSYAGGTVTATNQSITASDDLTGTSENLTGMLATNADIQAGDSGGPLVNASGQVIGMDTAGSGTFQFASQSSGSGFAIRISTATSIAQQITAGDSSSTVHVGTTAFLGVEIGESSNGFGPGSGYGYGGSGTANGVQISGVVSGSPAAGSGLSQGDVITSVDGHAVTSQSSLQTVMVNDVHPGQTISVQYTDTSGQQHTVSLVVTSGPPA
jgi:S1-C subfamily serine protease